MRSTLSKSQSSWRGAATAVNTAVRTTTANSTLAGNRNRRDMSGVRHMLYEPEPEEAENPRAPPAPSWPNVPGALVGRPRRWAGGQPHPAREGRRVGLAEPNVFGARSLRA